MMELKFKSRDCKGGEMRLLFFEVLVNFRVVSDHLGVCFNRCELSQNGGQSNLPQGKSWGTRTIGMNWNT